MSTDQIRELGAGLELSGCRFLWVVRSAKVDREEAAEIEELVGEGYVERVDGRGLVVREWVEQESVLAHRAVAGFLSHCGWNSVIEAAAAGVKVLAWPRMGDQRVNAEVVGASGLGMWPEEWAWESEGLVAAEEIGRTVKEVMHDAKVGEAAARVAMAAAAAVAEGGSSDKSIKLLIEKISK
ncbi:hypothetical protein HPP92_026692 [Vanilla planifolia]|nr:hypothetical protein HPP92_026692 [Vanilla planifolia]